MPGQAARFYWACGAIPGVISIRSASARTTKQKTYVVRIERGRYDVLKRVAEVALECEMPWGLSVEVSED